MFIKMMACSTTFVLVKLTYIESGKESGKEVLSTRLTEWHSHRQVFTVLYANKLPLNTVTIPSHIQEQSHLTAITSAHPSPERPTTSLIGKARVAAS